MKHRYDYPVRDSYGSGLYRRRVQLIGTLNQGVTGNQRIAGGQVFAQMGDPYHGMRCTLTHDGHVVTDIRADLPRTPLSTCPGAAEPIKKLIGIALDLPLRDISRHGNPRGNCTHLFDLTLGPGRQRYG